jgi:hypothetical protein
MGRRRIAELAGVEASSVANLISGRRRLGVRRPAVRISRAVAAAILAVLVPEVPAEVVAGGASVDSIGTVRRVQALVAAGYTLTWVADAMGMGVGNLASLLRRTRVTGRVARNVAEVYERHSHLPGPSSRSRVRARRHGWAPPLAWADNIDDPGAVPAGAVDVPVLDEILLGRILDLRSAAMVRDGAPDWVVPSGTRSVRVSRMDRPLYVARLVELGWSATAISRALGISGAASSHARNRLAALQAGPAAEPTDLLELLALGGAA